MNTAFDLLLDSYMNNHIGIDNCFLSEALANGLQQNIIQLQKDELMTAANFRTYRGGDIVVQVAGGVRGDLKSIVQNPETFEVSTEVAKKAAVASPIGQSGRWWWDAAVR